MLFQSMMNRDKSDDESKEKGGVLLRMRGWRS